jgi:hypothetical protein
MLEDEMETMSMELMSMELLIDAWDEAVFVEKDESDVVRKEVTLGTMATPVSKRG